MSEAAPAAHDYLTCAARGRNAWWRYLLTVIAALLLALPAMALLSVLFAMTFRLPLGDFSRQLTQPSNPRMFFAGLVIGFMSLSAGLAVAAALIQRKRFRDLIGDWHWPLFLKGVLIWSVIQLILAGIDVAIAPRGFTFSGGTGVPGLAAWALGGLLVQTFTEEFVFRGYLTQAILLAVKKPLPAACVSGLLFGAIHIPNGWPQALNAVCFGIVCALIAIRTGGIALTWGIHLANNYFGAVVVVSANDVFKGSPGLVIQNTPGLQWWDLGVSILALMALPWLLSRLGLVNGSILNNSDAP